MSERCPLDLSFDDGKEPSQVCDLQCGPIWANADVVGPYDRYNTDENCMAPTEFSHDALFVEGENGERRYVVVDICEEHGEEVGAQEYAFTCPYSKPNKIN